MNKAALAIFSVCSLFMITIFLCHKMDFGAKTQAFACCENVKKSKPPIAAEQRCNRYVTVFAYQSASVPRPFYSHVFANWSSEKDSKVSDGFTISWYGEKNVLWPQNGVNLSLADTYSRAAKQGLTVYRFGPYYCTEDFYQKAKKLHFSLCNKDYNVLDRMTKESGMFNCIHAVGYASGDDVETKALFGKEAAKKLVETFIARNLMTAKKEEGVWPAIKAYFLPSQ